jgi:hypothetical protein
MKRLILSLAIVASLYVTPAPAAGYRFGIYAGPGPYFAPYPTPYPVYRPYYYGPAYYPPPPPIVYRPYPPPYRVYPGFGVGYYSPGFSIRVGR